MRLTFDEVMALLYAFDVAIANYPSAKATMRVKLEKLRLKFERSLKRGEYHGKAKR